MKQFIELL